MKTLRTTQTNKQGGFTLIELMLGIAIFLIISGLGVPSYLSYVRNAEISNSGTKLMSDIYYARSEAIKRKSTIIICRSADVTLSSPSCGGNSRDWSSGWIVFVDVGGAAGSYDAGTDTILRVSSPPTTNISIMSNSNADTGVNFNSDGSLNVSTAPAIFSVCDDRDQDGDFDELSGREINIEMIGRPNLESGSITSCDSPA